MGRGVAACMVARRDRALREVIRTRGSMGFILVKPLRNVDAFANSCGNHGSCSFRSTESPQKRDLGTASVRPKCWPQQSASSASLTCTPAPRRAQVIAGECLRARMLFRTPLPRARNQPSAAVSRSFQLRLAPKLSRCARVRTYRTSAANAYLL
jgi:hypothetical protein